MKQYKAKTLSTAFALCATLGVQQAVQAVVTAPVGYVKLPFNAESDTPFSLPMNRPMVYSGQVNDLVAPVVSGITGNVISIANADFTVDELVYEFSDDDNDTNDQRERFYVLFTTGALEGRTFDIIDNTANTITVDPDYTEDNVLLEENLENLRNSLSANDNFEIRPHWTLDTLYLDGEGFPQASNLLATSSLIFTRPVVLDGTNLGTDRAYKYVTNVGWVDDGDLIAGQVRDVILRRNTGFIARNLTLTDLELNVMGDVPTVDGTVAVRSNLIFFSF